jgi:hypothetical protein
MNSLLMSEDYDDVTRRCGREPGKPPATAAATQRPRADVRISMAR